jgi:Family of unknown function (DUF6152)
MRDILRLCLACTVALAAAPALAHHSAAAEYDLSKTVTLQGTITKVEWTNPHIYFYVDVKDANGGVVNWAIAGASPIGLYRDGFKKDSLTVGDSVTVVGFPAWKVEHLADMKSVMLADGRKLLDRSGKQ